MILFFTYYNERNVFIYEKNNFKKTNGLINYWTFNGNVNDVIGNADLYDGVDAALTLDRFERPNSALSLCTGYYKVRPGVYFSGTQFTIMAWVKVKSFKSNSRLIDFIDANGGNHIVLALSDYSDLKPYLYIQSENKDIICFSTISLNLNQWHNLAYVFSFPFYSIYIDGTEIVMSEPQTTYDSFSLISVVRSSNFIGRSNFFDGLNDQDADADFDDLKIFNRAFDQNEILFEMDNNI